LYLDRLASARRVKRADGAPVPRQRDAAGAVATDRRCGFLDMTESLERPRPVVRAAAQREDIGSLPSSSASIRSASPPTRAARLRWGRTSGRARPRHVSTSIGDYLVARADRLMHPVTTTGVGNFRSTPMSGDINGFQVFMLWANCRLWRLIRAKLPSLRANPPICACGSGSRDTASLREHTTRRGSVSAFPRGFRAVPASPKCRQARFQKVPLAP
jgi:hypothetical protein